MGNNKILHFILFEIKDLELKISRKKYHAVISGNAGAHFLLAKGNN